MRNSLVERNSNGREERRETKRREASKALLLTEFAVIYRAEVNDIDHRRSFSSRRSMKHKFHESPFRDFSLRYIISLMRHARRVSPEFLSTNGASRGYCLSINYFASVRRRALTRHVGDKDE